MTKKVKERQLWITNISNSNVCLRDLALTIPTRRSMNLLDSKHFHYTDEQIEKSIASGSLFKKSRLIKIRVAEPEVPIPPGKYVSKMPMFMRYQIKAGVDMEEPEFEELQMSDEKFADELTEDDILLESPPEFLSDENL